MNPQEDQHQKKEPESQNGFLTQTVLDVMKVPTSSPESLKKMPWIIQNYLKYYVEKDKVNKILLQLEYSGLNGDLRKHENKEMNICNLSIFSAFFLTIFKFKRWSNKIIIGGAILSSKALYFDHYCMSRYLQRVGLQQNDAIAQEVRLLYRFYFPEEKVSQDFKGLCDKYLQVQEVRKNIHVNRNKL